MNESLKKFQDLLRELFQFDCADLDFGIYRIMNHKRDVIEQFIAEDLPNAMVGELDSGALVEQSRAVEELAEVADQIRNTLARDAIDADGNLVMFQESEIGKKYLNLQSKAVGSRGRNTLELAIFNHLHAFFSRYYQEGDFISKRRYSKNQRYAIPYNGEEVYLYWANSDQYYIKTAEYFHDYTYKVPNGVKVHFKVQAADVEQDNVKGDKRFFLPCVEAITYEEKASRLEIPFEYRPLTAQEEITYGKKNQQETILTHALRVIPDQFKKTQEPLSALTAEKSQNSDGEPITLLEHHLRQYTRRNKSDYFIHKDLKTFLSRELDFYLKNEVLSLDEMEAAGEDRAEGWFQMMRIIKSVGGHIIDFLNQIENFQKMLWEKRKFVTETEYCITIGNIDESFYADIAGCDAQWAEWKELFGIDEDQTDLFTSDKDKMGKRVEILKARPTLVLDTKHFDQDFVDRLLGSFDDLEEMTDGMLIHGENWQALNLLQECYREWVKCICIDPPYNTDSDDFLYKDSYKDSSWLSQQHQTLSISEALLTDTGSVFTFCDENEMHSYAPLLREVYGASNLVETIIWNKRVPKNDKGIGNIHDFIFLICRDFLKRRSLNQSYNMRKDELEDIYELVDRCKSQDMPLEDTQEELEKFYRKQGYDRGITLYHELDPTFKIWGKINMSWPNPKTEGPRYEVISPVTGKPVPIPKKGWRWTEETYRNAEEQGPIYRLSDGSMMKGRIWYAAKETTQPSSITYLDEVETFLLRSILSVKSDGSLALENLGLGELIDYPKPAPLIERLLFATGDTHGVVLDYFAGSGTTGHAVINLNREDGGQRKFILIEVGEYFDTVLLSRIKKVVFSSEWKDCKPQCMATPEEAERSPRIVKYMRLESYEDALNNIEFDEASNQMALEFDDYLLKYMMKWETRASETLLNVEKLARPFCYKIHIRADGQTREKVADIPETFNYLMGLHIETRRVYDDDGRYYLVYRGQTREGRRIAVIWRETEGWQKSDFERDKDFVADQKFSDGVDEVFVNGDSFIQEAKALEPMFKARMFAETGV